MLIITINQNQKITIYFDKNILKYKKYIRIYTISNNFSQYSNSTSYAPPRMCAVPFRYTAAEVRGVATRIFKKIGDSKRLPSESRAGRGVLSASQARLYCLTYCVHVSFPVSG